MTHTTYIVPGPSDDEQILKAEIELLEDELARLETELTTLRTTLARANKRFESTIGKRYLELDEIRVLVTRLNAHRSPTDASWKSRLHDAEEQYSRTKESYTAFSDAPEAEIIEPSEDIKSLYRKVAKRIHPDLAKDEYDRELRTRLMASANEAYERGDLQKLQDILDGYLSANPVSPLTRQLAALRTLLSGLKRRIDEVKYEIACLWASDTGQLYKEAQVREISFETLLTSLAIELDETIAKLHEEFAWLVRQRPKP